MKYTATIFMFVASVFLAGQPAHALPSDVWGTVEIIRDQWGVPNIYADTDEGAMYGLGYATAEDRAFQMTFALRTAQGRTAEVLGNVQNRKMSAVEFDIKMRTIGWAHAAKLAASNLDDESYAMLEAYCKGINDYFEYNEDNLPELFNTLNIKHEDWSPADSIAVWWNFARFFAPEGLHDTLVYLREQRAQREQQQAQEGREGEDRGGRNGRDGQSGRGDRARMARNFEPVIDDSASVIKKDDVDPEWIALLEKYAEAHGLIDSESGEQGPKFSHAWAVGGKKTSTGSAVLVSDPQTPVRNPSLLYEFHIDGKTINARGIGVPGSPIILIGYNERVAWGATALGADQADQFFLKTDEEHPNQYFFEGEWRDMQVWQETIKVHEGEDQTFTMRWTHFGPVGSRVAHGVTENMEVALKRIPVSETDRETIQGGLKMMRARNVYEFEEALEGWLFPSANFVSGDQQGNVGYWANAAIPVRSRHAKEHGKMTHQGTEAKYDWQEILPYELLPHVINPDEGYVFSANHRPIESFYPIPIGISTGSLGDGSRSRRLRERLEMQDTFTPEDVLDIHYDNVNPSRRDLVRLGYYLRDETEVELPENTLKTLEYLHEWYGAGSHMDLTIHGTELANEISTFFRIVATPLAQVYGGGNSGLALFLKTAIERLEEHPEAGLTDAEAGYVIDSLSQAWSNCLNKYGNDPATWNEKARAEVDNRVLQYQATLDGFGGLDEEMNVSYPPLRTVDGGTIFSQAAQSYSQWVPLHDVDQAMAILPIGISEREGNPYRLSQMKNWQTGKMRPAPISRAAVENLAAERLVLVP